jgi:predicted CopG family antitoxin
MDVAVKTISLKEEAYRRLKNARRYPGESFSEIVMRASWPEDTITARALLNLHTRNQSFFSDAELERIASIKHSDGPPDDKWADR